MMASLGKTRRDSQQNPDNRRDSSRFFQKIKKSDFKFCSAVKQHCGDVWDIDERRFLDFLERTPVLPILGRVKPAHAMALSAMVRRMNFGPVFGLPEAVQSRPSVKRIAMAMKCGTTKAGEITRQLEEACLIRKTERRDHRGLNMPNFYSLTPVFYWEYCLHAMHKAGQLNKPRLAFILRQRARAIRSERRHQLDNPSRQKIIGLRSALKRKLAKTEDPQQREPLLRKLTHLSTFTNQPTSSKDRTGSQKSLSSDTVSQMLRWTSPLSPELRSFSEGSDQHAPFPVLRSTNDKGMTSDTTEILVQASEDLQCPPKEDASTGGGLVLRSISNEGKVSVVSQNNIEASEDQNTHAKEEEDVVVATDTEHMIPPDVLEVLPRDRVNMEPPPFPGQTYFDRIDLWRRWAEASGMLIPSEKEQKDFMDRFLASGHDPYFVIRSLEIIEDCEPLKKRWDKGDKHFLGRLLSEGLHRAEAFERGRYWKKVEHYQSDFVMICHLEAAVLVAMEHGFDPLRFSRWILRAPDLPFEKADYFVQKTRKREQRDRERLEAQNERHRKILELENKKQLDPERYIENPLLRDLKKRKLQELLAQSEAEEKAQEPAENTGGNDPEKPLPDPPEKKNSEKPAKEPPPDPREQENTSSGDQTSGEPDTILLTGQRVQYLRIGILMIKF